MTKPDDKTGGATATVIHATEFEADAKTLTDLVKKLAAMSDARRERILLSVNAYFGRGQ